VIVASKHMFLYGGLVTFFGAVGRRRDTITMHGCIKKAVEWCEDLPSRDATYVKKMKLSDTIGVTLKEGVWRWACDTMNL
jgi:hypothetical protein